MTRADPTRRHLLRASPVALAGLLLGRGFAADAQDFAIEMPGEPPAAPPVGGGATLFTDVRVFDGTSPTLSPARGSCAGYG